MTDKDGKMDRIFFRTAMTVPVVQAASKCSWAAALGIGAACLGICRGMEKIQPQGRRMRGLKWIWLILSGGSILRWIGYGWQSGSPVIPGTILLLSAWTAAGGGNRSLAAGNVLRFWIAALLGTVLISGLWDIRGGNLKPDWAMSGGEIVTVLLLPAAIPMKGQGKRAGWYLLAAACAVSAVTVGVLTEDYALRHESPFYELSRNVQLLGTAKRFESLGAAGLTLGYYVFFTRLLRGCADWGAGLGIEEERKTVWLSAAGMGASYLLGSWKHPEILALGAAASCVGLPLLAYLGEKVRKRKILRKSEKGG